MKVLEVVHGFPPDCHGGTESFVEGLSQGLASRGVEILVVSGALESRTPAQTSESRWKGLRVVRIHRPDSYYETWERSYSEPAGRLFAGILERERPDLVHVHHWLRLSRDLVARAHAAGVPTVLTLHDFGSTCLICFRVKADDSFCTVPLAVENCHPCVGTPAGMEPADAAAEIGRLREDLLREIGLARERIALSSSQASILSRVTGRPLSDFRVLPLGPVKRLRRAPHRPRGPGEPLRVISFGHLFHLKGQHLLLEAVRRARARERIRVALFGLVVYPEYEKRLRALAEGIAVEFRGTYEVQDLEGTDADLAVFPTLAAETYGFVLDEAAALGIPAAVPDLGAMRERVGDGGLVLPRGDVGAIASLLDDAFERPALLEEVRAKVRPPAGSFDAHVEAVLGLYRGIAR
ncbi:MAG: glycosyltransferase [Planctomycetes bacterium]|nr:glycosyltransferase [Planctomycetota bacterium]